MAKTLAQPIGFGQKLAAERKNGVPTNGKAALHDSIFARGASQKSLIKEIAEASSEQRTAHEEIAALKAEIAKLEQKKAAKIGAALKWIKERHDIELSEYYIFENIIRKFGLIETPLDLGAMFFARRNGAIIRGFDKDNNETHKMSLDDFYSLICAQTDKMTVEWAAEIFSLREKNSLIAVRKELVSRGGAIDFYGLMISEADDDKIIDWVNLERQDQEWLVLDFAMRANANFDHIKAREVFESMDKAELSGFIFKQIKAMHTGLVDVMNYYEGDVRTVEICKKETLEAIAALEKRHAQLRDILGTLGRVGARKRIDYINTLAIEIRSINELKPIVLDIEKKGRQLGVLEYKAQVLSQNLAWKKGELAQLSQE